jgi:hypothetical protein
MPAFRGDDRRLEVERCAGGHTGVDFPHQHLSMFRWIVREGFIEPRRVDQFGRCGHGVHEEEHGNVFHRAVTTNLTDYRIARNIGKHRGDEHDGRTVKRKAGQRRRAVRTLHDGVAGSRQNASGAAACRAMRIDNESRFGGGHCTLHRVNATAWATG